MTFLQILIKNFDWITSLEEYSYSINAIISLLYPEKTTWLFQFLREIISAIITTWSYDKIPSGWSHRKIKTAAKMERGSDWRMRFLIGIGWRFLKRMGWCMFCWRFGVFDNWLKSNLSFSQNIYIFCLQLKKGAGSFYFCISFCLVIIPRYYIHKQNDYLIFSTLILVKVKNEQPKTKNIPLLRPWRYWHGENALPGFETV